MSYCPRKPRRGEIPLSGCAFETASEQPSTQEVVDYQHDSRGREEYGVGKSGDHFSQKAAAEDLTVRRRSAASVVKQAVRAGQASRPERMVAWCAAPDRIYLSSRRPK